MRRGSTPFGASPERMGGWRRWKLILLGLSPWRVHRYAVICPDGACRLELHTKFQDAEFDALYMNSRGHCTDWVWPQVRSELGPCPGGRHEVVAVTREEILVEEVLQS